MSFFNPGKFLSFSSENSYTRWKYRFLYILIHMVHFFGLFDFISNHEYSDDLVWYLPAVNTLTANKTVFEILGFIFSGAKEYGIPTLNIIYYLWLQITGNSSFSLAVISFLTFYTLIHLSRKYIKLYYKISDFYIFIYTILILFSYPIFDLYLWPIAIQHQVALIGIFLLLIVYKNSRYFELKFGLDGIKKLLAITSIFFVVGYFRSSVLMVIPMLYWSILHRSGSSKRFLNNLIYWFLPVSALLYHFGASMQRNFEGHQVANFTGFLFSLKPEITGTYLDNTIYLTFLLLLTNTFLFWMGKIYYEKLPETKKSSILLLLIFSISIFTIFAIDLKFDFSFTRIFGNIVYLEIFPPFLMDHPSNMNRWRLLRIGEVSPTFLGLVVIIFLVFGYFLVIRKKKDILHFIIPLLFIVTYHINMENNEHIGSIFRAGMPSRYSSYAIFLVLFIFISLLSEIDRLNNKYSKVLRTFFILAIIPWAIYSISTIHYRMTQDRFMTRDYISSIRIYSELLGHDLSVKERTLTDGEKKDTQVFLPGMFRLVFWFDPSLFKHDPVNQPLIFAANSRWLKNTYYATEDKTKADVFFCQTSWCNASSMPINPYKNESFQIILDYDPGSQIDLSPDRVLELSHNFFIFSKFSNLQSETNFLARSNDTSWIEFLKEKTCASGRIDCIPPFLNDSIIQTELAVIGCVSETGGKNIQSCDDRYKIIVFNNINFNYYGPEKYFLEMEPGRREIMQEYLHQFPFMDGPQ